MYLGVLVAIGLSLVALLGGLLLRRRLLLRSGALECGLRHARGGSWSVGLLVPARSELRWFRTLSARPSPSRRLARDATVLLGQRRPLGSELGLFPAGTVVLRCRSGPRDLELALPTDSATGLLAWLEASAPGETRRPAP